MKLPRYRIYYWYRVADKSPVQKTFCQRAVSAKDAVYMFQLNAANMGRWQEFKVIGIKLLDEK